MARQGIQIQGMRELRRALKDAEGRSPKELAAANQDAAAIVAREAQRRAPVRTGKLRGSIRPLRQAARGIVAAGRASVPYAGVTEYGGTIPRWHSDARTTIPRQAFLNPAADAKEHEVVQSYEAALRRITRDL